MARTLSGRSLGTLALVFALLLALLTRTSSPATAADTVTLSTSTTSLAIGQPLTFSYAAPADQVFATNWIGLFQGKGCVSPSTHWLYTANGSTSTPSTAVASGTLTFDTTGWAAGSYSVCFLADDGYAVIGGPLTVRLQGPGVSVESTTVPVGTPVTVSYLAPSGQVSTTNWIGWYRGKSTCGSGSTYWNYTQTGTQSPPPSGTPPVASGSLTFTGMTVGSYAVCLLYDDGYTIIGSPVIINVVDSAYSVTVTSSGHGTASASPLSAKPGQQVTLSQTPDVGYTFGGWHVSDPADGSLVIGSDDTFTMPGRTVGIRAVFDPDSATVQFHGNGADAGSMTDQTVAYGVAAPLAPNGFTRSGSAFAGWATSAVGPVVYADGDPLTDAVPTDGATIALFARWRPAGQFLVSLDDVDHVTATTSSSAAAPGDPVALTASAEAGYHLTGWNVVDPASLTVGSDGTFTMPDADVEVAPQVDANTYRVTYHGNGADAGTTDDSLFTYDVAAPLAPDGFVRDGYRFAGWSTTPAGPVAYPDQATVQDLTAVEGGVVDLYARWTLLRVEAGSWPTLARGFVSDTFKLPATTTSGAVSQPLLGLWNGAAPAAFTKVSGDSWLQVSSDGTVSGTAPSHAPKDAGEITVSATTGGATSSILVEVPVAASHASPEVATASWNVWQAGRAVDDAVGKNLAVVAARGLGVIGFQDGGYAMAQSVGAALGWSVHGQGDLGIVSAYPVVTGPGNAGVFPTSTVPATAETVSVAGAPVRVWDVHLDEADYGPYAACFDGAGATRLISGELATTRYAQARAVVQAMGSDVRSGSPVLMLGDLASPASSDWTPHTAPAHCGVGAVAWPVPDLFTRAGMVDSYRSGHPDPVQAPGVTWSPVVATHDNGKPEPQDRIDYVDYVPAGLTLTSSDAMWLGWPSATHPAGNSWASDHAAVVSRFLVGGGGHGH